MDIGKIIGLPSRQVVTYVVPTLIKQFDFFNKLAQIVPATLAEISVTFGFEPRVVVTTMDYLCKEGFVERDGNVYVLSPMTKQFLLKSADFDMSNYATILDGNVPDKIGEAISFALTTGEPARWDRDGSWEEGMRSGRLAKSFSDGVMARGRFLSQKLAETLSPSLRNRRLLDIGGSLGDYCGTISQVVGIETAVFELPQVAEKTSENIASKGYKKVAVISGDMFTDQLPTGFDAHMYSNVIHDWDYRQNSILLRKSHEALPEKGMVLIHDMHLYDDKMGPDFVVDHSLYLSIFTEGRCYSKYEMTQLLKMVGFHHLQVYDTSAGYSAIIGYK